MSVALSFPGLRYFNLVSRRRLIMGPVKKIRFRIEKLEERIAPSKFQGFCGGSKSGGSKHSGSKHSGGSKSGGSRHSGGSKSGGSKSGGSHHGGSKSGGSKHGGSNNGGSKVHCDCSCPTTK